ncbi:MAG: sulfatase-like hydrolase/transferase, partial [Gammaproteobacteria bacterium]|nr:sulfatase-like hydrolase/transferase [Gammaproteobacteria bacterium]
ESEPRPGKSCALNLAISLFESEFIAFVDDDHRIPHDFLVNISDSISEFSDASMWCGRIHPDWTGDEPSWVHDKSQYRIYPLPVPNFDLGDQPLRITSDTAVPGGGNIVVRRSLFDEIGGFSEELGPHGHDLGGSEDSDFVYRALAKNKTIQYDPRLLQHHYVDLSRFTLGYLIKKGFQRSRTITQVKAHLFGGRVPAYVWRKLVEHVARALLSLSWRRTRFFLVRIAATWGEISGIRQSRLSTPPKIAPIAMTSLLVSLVGCIAYYAGGRGVTSTIVSDPVSVLIGAAAAFIVAGCVTFVVTLRSATHYTRTGPQVRREVSEHFAGYTILAVARLSAWTFAISSALAVVGAYFYACYTVILQTPYELIWATTAAACSFCGLTALQFVRHLLYIPSSITASSAYRLSRLYPLWRSLSPEKIRLIELWLSAAALILWLGASISLIKSGQWTGLGAFAASGAILIGIAVYCRFSPVSRQIAPFTRQSAEGSRPNVVMIGADTLRADRLGSANYHRALTPFLDELAESGTLFTSCHVPLARTAPSLVSMLTGTWPHTHGIRSNYVPDDQTRLRVEALPSLLKKHGYHTAAISDWAGADLGKISFGFDEFDGPEDQWNLRFYLRQGPMDLRLFLSLFTNNRFGKACLPEIYYLAGVPLTTHLGTSTCNTISRLSEGDKPFFLNVFMATAHVPFGCEYPYYLAFSDRDYNGESKFVMSKFADPMEIIEMQEADRSAFDVEQIINLYDSCVMRFDDEVKRIVSHLRETGIADDTIIIIYSDHGTDFFENGTWGQGNNVLGNDPSGRIPLLLIDPRQPEAPREIDQITRSIDLVPTLADLLGIPCPNDVDGVSLAPLLAGGALDKKLDAFEETGVWLGHIPGVHPDHIRYPNVLELLGVPDKTSGTLAIKPEYAETIIKAKDRMVRNERWKLIYQPLVHGCRYLLYDMVNDPCCAVDVAEEHPEVVSELTAKLTSWMAMDPERELVEGHMQPRTRSSA